MKRPEAGGLPGAGARRRSATIASLATIVALFIAAIGTPQLYYQNQHTKFLHGLATAFPDRLGADWTAATADGLPVFTALVHGIAAWFDPRLFYLLEAALLAVMCVSLVLLARAAAPRNGDRLAFLAIAGAVIVLLVHPAQEDALRGVAGQYMTHGYLQPSEFGILYLPAALLAMRRHPAALLLAAIPAAFHPAYVAFSAITVAVFAWDRWRSGERIPPLVIVPALLLLVLPPLDLAYRFAPTDAESFAKANEILAFERIPHHSDPGHWADWVAFRKAIIVLLGVMLAPRGVLRWLLGVLFFIAAAGAGFVALIGNAEIALMAPWRTSIILVPVSTAIVIGWVLDRLPDRPRLWVALAGASGLLAVWAGLDGLATKWRSLAIAGVPDHAAYVLANHDPKDLYLTDPAYYRFRLEAMAAQFVTWKTHPYLDTEVLEWSRRAEMAERVFLGGSVDCAALDDLLADYEVSHLLGPTQDASAAPCEGLSEDFRGASFTVYSFVGAR